MTGSTEPNNTPNLTEDQLMEAAAELVLAVKLSIPHGSINPLDLWPRLQAATLTASHRATTYREMASLMLKKVGVEAPRKASSRWISLVGKRIDGQFKAFRRLCEAMPQYVVVEAQVMTEEGTDAPSRLRVGLMPHVDSLNLYEPPEDAPFEAKAHHYQEQAKTLKLHYERACALLRTSERDNKKLREALQTSS